LTTCIKNNEALNIEKKKSGFNRRSQAAAAAYRKANFECSEVVKENYVKNGGDEKKLSKSKQAAAESKVSNAIRSCVGEKMKALIVQNKHATREEYQTFQKECDAVAEEKLLEAGGDIGEYNKVKAEGAKKAGGDQMKKCAESGIDRTVLAQKKTAKERMDYIKTEMAKVRSKCEEESKQAFIESGGDGGDETEYKKAMESDRPEKIKSSMSSCISNTVGDVSGYDAKKRSLLYRQASLKCNTKAKEAHVMSGGDEKKFALEKQKAERNTVMNAYSACMKEKIVPLQGKKISRDNYTMFQKDCRSEAEQEFEQSGGDLKDFEVVKKAAASNNAVETLQACVKDEVAKKNLNKDSNKKERYDAYKAARTTCSQKGEDAFVEGGGSVEKDEKVNVNLKYKEAIKAAQGKKVAETLRACMNSKVDKTKTGKALAQEYRKANLECDEKAKDEHLRSGGDPKEFAKDKKDAEVNAVKDAMKSCIKEAILALNTTEDVSDDTKTQFQKQCVEDARNEFRENGGNVEEFELAKKEAARKEASDKMETCVESSELLKACGEDKKCRGDKYSAAAENCNADTKAAFIEAGGSKEEFEVEKQKAQKAKIKNTMSTCIKSRAVPRDKFNAALETCTTAELKDKTEATGKDKYMARKKCYKTQAVQTELKALQTAYRAAKKECTDTTKDAYAKVGGKPEKFVQETRKAAVTELRATLRSCIDQKMRQKI
jgi:phosphoribosylformylglycinamidine (FGAM) synthase PurS component